MNTDSLTRSVSRQAGWSIFMGILTAAAGVAMILYPMVTATASTVFLGALLIVAGGAQLVFAFSAGSAGKVVLNVLLGILYGIAGVSLMAFPGLGVLTLTAMLGAMLIAEAVLEFAIAFTLPSGAGRGGFVLNAVLSFLLGLMILAHWPSSSIWAIGTLVGTAVLFNGSTRAVISGWIRHEARALAGAKA